MVIENGIVTCKIVCCDTEKEEMGIKTQEILLGFSFELADIACIRQILNEDDELMTDRCTISLFGVHYSINIPYIELRKEWITSKAKPNV